MRAGSVISAMARSSPPQRGQVERSMANTRFNRAIQLIGVVGALGWGSSLGGLLTALGRVTTSARSHALGANKPWYLTR